ncbi:MAG: hypothetical protein ACI8ZX_001422 [Planctomycetota bacterium]
MQKCSIKHSTKTLNINLMTNYFIIRILTSVIGIVCTIFFTPILNIIEWYYIFSESFSINENSFAIISIIMVTITYFFLSKNIEKYLSLVLFSSIYYLFIPISIMQLMYYDTTDGQTSLVIFPIFIVASILLFFLLNIFEKNDIDSTNITES